MSTNCTDLRAVACALDSYMGRTGASKAETARELGIGRDALKNKLRGKTQFKASELRELRRLTGLSIDKIIV